MAEKGKYFRRPASRAIAYMSWTATAKTVRSGKREVRPGSLGIVDVAFARNPAKYYYILSTPLKYSIFRAWTNASSKGRFWNNYLLGRY